MAAIRKEWPEVERYLIEMRRNISTYSGEVFDTILSRVKARAFPKR